MTSITITVPNQLAAKLDKTAADSGRARNDLIIEAITGVLGDVEREWRIHVLATKLAAIALCAPNSRGRHENPAASKAAEIAARDRADARRRPRPRLFGVVEGGGTTHIKSHPWS